MRNSAHKSHRQEPRGATHGQTRPPAIGDLVLRLESPFSSLSVLFRNHPIFQALAHFLKRRILEENGEGTARLVGK